MLIDQLWAGDYTDLRKFLYMSVASFSGHGPIAGAAYRAGKAGAQAAAQSERRSAIWRTGEAGREAHVLVI